MDSISSDKKFGVHLCMHLEKYDLETHLSKACSSRALEKPLTLKRNSEGDRNSTLLPMVCTQKSGLPSARFTGIPSCLSALTGAQIHLILRRGPD